MSLSYRAAAFIFTTGGIERRDKFHPNNTSFLWAKQHSEHDIDMKTVSQVVLLLFCVFYNSSNTPEYVKKLS